MFEGLGTSRVQVGEASVLVRHGGHGPPVVLLHGHPRTSATGHRVAPLLVRRGFTVVCPDLRGYGRADAHRRPLRVLQARRRRGRGRGDARPRARPVRTRGARPGRCRRAASRPRAPRRTAGTTATPRAWGRGTTTSGARPCGTPPWCAPCWGTTGRVSPSTGGTRRTTVPPGSVSGALRWSSGLSRTTSRTCTGTRYASGASGTRRTGSRHRRGASRGRGGPGGA